MRAEAKSTVTGTLRLVLVSFLISGSFAQEPKLPSSAQATIRIQSSLVLVDVISQDSKNGLPVREFQKEDFRVLDNGNEVRITSFDAGAHYSTRPFILWLAVICNEGGKIGGSREFVGKESVFRPALDHLDKHENTYRKMLRLIIQDAHRRNPQPLPVIVFLDGDHTGQPRYELDQVVNDILETSGIVFGIKDQMSPRVYGLGNGEQAEISHYVAEQTGGEYFTAPARDYATALDMILMRLHFRYELGFVPPKIDGKRHELRVELTKEAQRKYKGVRLWFRPEYIPVSEAPAWAR